VPLISAIGASFFSDSPGGSPWRNTFYLNYPTLDILDENILGGAVEVPLNPWSRPRCDASPLSFVNKTRLGKRSAPAQDPDAAALMGIPVNRTSRSPFSSAARWAAR
jgi:hypothetical protein